MFIIIIYFPSNNNSTSFKFKQKITRKTENSGTKDVAKMVPLKYLGNFWKTFEVSLIDFKINLSLKWSENYFLVAGTVAFQKSTFTITDTKTYVLVVTLSNQDNVKLLKKLEYGFKKQLTGRNINLKKTQAQKQYLDFLIDPSFQGVKRLCFERIIRK